jgi:antitoxin VapB
MARTAKLFRNGRSQAVRLPAEFRFAGDEVLIRRDPRTGEVILSQKPADWGGVFEAIDAAGGAADAYMTHPRTETPERGDVL